MFIRFGIVMTALALSFPAKAESELDDGFSGALRGCEEWVLNPSSWIVDFDDFASTVGLGDKMGLVQSVDQANLPPEQFRVANYFWRINSTENAGYVLVVSSEIPMCHITGGGNSDLQPVVERVLAGSDFLSRWTSSESKSQGDIVSTTYSNREEPDFRIVISRASEPGQRLDRVQLLATAIYNEDE